MTLPPESRPTRQQMVDDTVKRKLNIDVGQLHDDAATERAAKEEQAHVRVLQDRAHGHMVLRQHGVLR